MSIQKIIDIIENNSHVYEILKNCPYQILKKWSIFNYHSGEMILRQGERFDYFFIIVQGTVNIYMMSENGKKYSQAVYKDGDFIGELEIFDHAPSACYVEAINNLKLIGLHMNEFCEWLRVDSHMSHYFNRTLAKYLYNLSKKAGMDSLYSLKYRLCNYFLDHMKALNEESNEFIVKVDKTQISDQLAVTSRSINRILQEWKEKGLIKIRHDSISITNLNFLIDEKNKSMLE
ncbi:Crp/Fnr family transcriptional regulator [Heyndrickxia camelliae]|uniref:Crp/Fnr family transcriptional regulator n=1 Tax=Heyndrickxia camelliae TaxID=1707093 RepID=A0A2N3LP29_9BACI|nr:Crp/Fnr family transcriptional regulator [Heyndrickxia camelliae]PKR86327.1 Crp/Fnr family transcriptional regulator [Heyndrickxia camelliae]